jgi:hypothetical protein
MNAKIEVKTTAEGEATEIIEYLRICSDMPMPTVSNFLLTTSTINAPENWRKYLNNSIKISLGGE